MFTGRVPSLVVGTCASPGHRVDGVFELELRAATNKILVRSVGSETNPHGTAPVGNRKLRRDDVLRSLHSTSETWPRRLDPVQLLHNLRYPLLVHWVPSLWAGLREAGTSPGPFLLLLEFTTLVNVYQLIRREFLNLEPLR